MPEFPKTKEFVGIDLGMRTLATLDNGLKIANLDVNSQFRRYLRGKHDQKIPKKDYPDKKTQQQPLQKNTKNLLEMDRPKKEQNKRLLPQNNHKNH